MFNAMSYTSNLNLPVLRTGVDRRCHSLAHGEKIFWDSSEEMYLTHTHTFTPAQTHAFTVWNDQKRSTMHTSCVGIRAGYRSAGHLWIHASSQNVRQFVTATP